LPWKARSRPEKKPSNRFYKITDFFVIADPSHDERRAIGLENHP
jgi:hypothetical protein